MGLSGFLEQAIQRNALPHGDLHSPERVAKWIDSVAPCVQGAISEADSETILKHLKLKGASDGVLGAALAKASTKFRFSMQATMRYQGVFAETKRHPAYTNKSGLMPQPQHAGSMSKAEFEQSKRYAFEEYERRYVLAIKTNDVAGAEAILVAVLELLWGLAQAHGEAMQTARNEALVEWGEFNAAVDQALARAMTLRTHVRYLSRDDIRSLRNAPTPASLRNVTFRIAQTVTTRTVPPARRVRR
jgi:hypothetical protein